MRPILFDSSVYITGLRTGDEARLTLRQLPPEAPLWLSAVVLEELYAGADPRGCRVLERLERDLSKAGRILVPNLQDWALAGKVLARLAAETGHEPIGQARLTHDALIAMSAARLGITVITTTARDFARLARLRPFLWEVRTW